MLLAWLVDGSLAGTGLYAVLGAYPTALTLGVTAFFFFSGGLVQARPTPLNCGIVGAVVASAPWCLFLLLLVVFPPLPDAGLVAFVGKIAVAGAFGGVMFWLAAAARLARTST